MPDRYKKLLSQKYDSRYYSFIGLSDNFYRRGGAARGKKSFRFVARAAKRVRATSKIVDPLARPAYRVQ